MWKGKSLYFFIAIVFIVGFIAGGILFRASVKPAITPVPSAETEKAPVAPVKEAPSAPEVPIVEVPLAETPAEEEKPALAAALPEEKAPEAVTETGAPKVAKYDFQKGIIYVAWTENGYSNANSVAAMEQMRSAGADWAGLVTTWYQEKNSSTEISPVKDKTPSDESLIFAIRKLHDLKFKVMLKPHLDLILGEGNWRGDIAPVSPQDWQKWSDSYTAFILHYANIAAQENAEIFCIGTELTQATLTQPKYWRELIAKVRQVYKGKLTYAANWHQEFNQIEFWDALDYAGIDPYFPLVCSMAPKVEELKSAWGDWLKTIEPWQQKINKPVIFAEIGYKSVEDATDEPWQYVGMGKLDLELQANCYRALLETFWDKPWFYGAYWWYWGTNPRMGGELNKGFTPQNKPAHNVIKEWYTSKPVSEKAY
ncbi:MAG: hypothetical protein FJZ13_01705 [Candidatus Omnitrophica bacterium]|nr:hypothetical protein [Candidatus Omnitrophota bacterium]